MEIRGPELNKQLVRQDQLSLKFAHSPLFFFFNVYARIITYS